MKMYFLSAEPCALFLNELYYGAINAFERFIELSLSDKIYARFCPQNKLAVGLFLDESLLENPPSNVEIYHLQDGVAVYVKEFFPTDFSLQVVCQKQESDVLATVFFQGSLQLSIQSSLGYFNAALPPSFSNCEVFFHEHLCILKSEKTLGVYSLKAEKLLVENVLEYTLEGNTLTAILPLFDRFGRNAKCSWLLLETGTTRTEFTILQQGNEKERENLLPYAFFESVLIGGEYACFLSEELQNSAEKIRAFLGDFLDVIPTDNPLVCGLVKQKKERVFEVVNYTVEIKEGKICDVFV